MPARRQRRRSAIEARQLSVPERPAYASLDGVKFRPAVSQLPTGRGGNGIGHGRLTLNPGPQPSLGSNQVELSPHLLERDHSLVQIGLGMTGRNLAPHSRLTLRDDRESEPRYEDAFREHHVTHLDRGSRLTDDDGHDGRVSRQWFEPGFG